MSKMNQLEGRLTEIRKDVVDGRQSQSVEFLQFKTAVRNDFGNKFDEIISFQKSSEIRQEAKIDKVIYLLTELLTKSDRQNEIDDKLLKIIHKLADAGQMLGNIGQRVTNIGKNVENIKEKMTNAELTLKLKTSENKQKTSESEYKIKKT